MKPGYVPPKTCGKPGLVAPGHHPPGAVGAVHHPPGAVHHPAPGHHAPGVVPGVKPGMPVHKTGFY